MKKLVLFGLIISAATGCIISSGDDDGSPPTITAHWDILQVNGTSLSCPPTYDTAALYSQKIDDGYTDLGPPVIDLFDCDAFTADSAPLSATTYLSWVAIETHDGSQTYASTTEHLVDLTDTDQTFSAHIYDDGGYFEMMWQLTKSSNGAPVGCSDVAGIAGVESISTATVGSSQAIVDQFKCTDHDGITSVLPAGTYTVSVDAFNGATPPAALGTADDQLNKTINDHNEVTDLHTITIPIDSL